VYNSAKGGAISVFSAQNQPSKIPQDTQKALARRAFALYQNLIHDLCCDRTTDTILFFLAWGIQFFGRGIQITEIFFEAVLFPCIWYHQALNNLRCIAFLKSP